MKMNKGDVCGDIEEYEDTVRFVIWFKGQEDKTFRFAPEDAFAIRSVIQQLEEESK
jgi:vacuolar-type H+-ATPase catalytic subunit A/Vma1